MATGKLVDLSVQQVVDCDNTCYGCDGGWTDKAWLWVTENGLETEKEYPYEGEDNTCRYVNSSVVVRLSEYEAVTPLDVDALKTAIAVNGPISVVINAENNFQFYDSGK